MFRYVYEVLLDILDCGTLECTEQIPTVHNIIGKQEKTLQLSHRLDSWMIFLIML